MSGPRRRLVGEGREEEASCVVAERQSPGLLSRARDGAADERLLDAFDLDGEVGRVHAGAVGIEDRGGVVLLDAVGLNDEGLLELSVEARVNVLKDDAAGGVDGFGRDACRMGEDGSRYGAPGPASSKVQTSRSAASVGGTTMVRVSGCCRRSARARMKLSAKLIAMMTAKLRLKPMRSATMDV